MAKRLEDFTWETKHDIPKNSTVNLNNVNAMLDSVGCGFCLAKFKQVTMHLGTGMTHACHHPAPHKIPLEELEDNPAALFNTQHLKNARKQMLNDEKPVECDYCWRVEASGGHSDRHFKSVEPWALTSFNDMSVLSGDEDLYPSYLEVSFSNACNLACTYCGPEFSSKWVENLKQHGPVKILEETDHEQWVQGWQDLDSLNYKNRDDNPYVEAFWKWFPEAYKHLKHYRITGGEPLMSKETFKSIDWFIENPNPELEFSINSNFSVPDKLWDKFIEKLEILKTGQKVKKITIYTSAEGWGDRAEYARTHMDFKLLKSRVEQIVSMGNVRCVIMSAFNIFSLTSFKEMLEWTLELKRRYNPCNSMLSTEQRTGFKITSVGTASVQDRYDRNMDQAIVMGIDIPYLRHPEFLDVQYCSDELVEEYLIPMMEFMADNVDCDLWCEHTGFERYEIEKLKRIVMNRLHYNMDNSDVIEKDTMLNRAKFYQFVRVHDSRNGTNFLETFPEMTDYYELCKESFNEYKKQ